MPVLLYLLSTSGLFSLPFIEILFHLVISLLTYNPEPTHPFNSETNLFHRLVTSPPPSFTSEGKDGNAPVNTFRFVHYGWTDPQARRPKEGLTNVTSPQLKTTSQILGNEPILDSVSFLQTQNVISVNNFRGVYSCMAFDFFPPLPLISFLRRVASRCKVYDFLPHKAVIPYVLGLNSIKLCCTN